MEFQLAETLTWELEIKVCLVALLSTGFRDNPKVTSFLLEWAKVLIWVRAKCHRIKQGVETHFSTRGVMFSTLTWRPSQRQFIFTAVALPTESVLIKTSVVRLRRTRRRMVARDANRRCTSHRCCPASNSFNIRIYRADQLSNSKQVRCKCYFKMLPNPASSPWTPPATLSSTKLKMESVTSSKRARPWKTFRTITWFRSTKSIINETKSTISQARIMEAPKPIIEAIPSVKAWKVDAVFWIGHKVPRIITVRKTSWTRLWPKSTRARIVSWIHCTTGGTQLCRAWPTTSLVLDTVWISHKLCSRCSKQIAQWLPLLKLSRDR